MSRPCSLCGATSGRRLVEERWPVVGLGEVDLGFRWCDGCGLVRQDPAAPQETLLRYYTLFSNYTNPGRSGRPSPHKQRGMTALVDALASQLPRRGRCLQVGSSDGYTLSRLRDAGWDVHGIDPSPAACDLANRLYGVPTTCCSFETFRTAPGDSFDLVFLSHVLEHLADPAGALARCRRLLGPDGHLFVEVPALVDPDRWPPGYFSLEHLSYFAPETLEGLLRKTGFAVEGGVRVWADAPLYPIMRALCVPATADRPDLAGAARRTLDDCLAYLSRERRQWQRVDRLLARAVPAHTPTLVWGAGIHTSQLLARTGLARRARVEGIVDSDPQKWGQRVGPHPVVSPDRVDYADPRLTIVISTRASEDEVYRTIVERPACKARVVRLYADQGGPGEGVDP